MPQGICTAGLLECLFLWLFKVHPQTPCPEFSCTPPCPSASPLLCFSLPCDHCLACCWPYPSPCLWSALPLECKLLGALSFRFQSRAGPCRGSRVWGRRKGERGGAERESPARTPGPAAACPQPPPLPECLSVSTCRPGLASACPALSPRAPAASSSPTSGGGQGRGRSPGTEDNFVKPNLIKKQTTFKTNLKSANARPRPTHLRVQDAVPSKSVLLWSEQLCSMEMPLIRFLRTPPGSSGWRVYFPDSLDCMKTGSCTCANAASVFWARIEHKYTILGCLARLPACPQIPSANSFCTQLIL